MHITHDNITLIDFYKICRNAKEIKEKYNINDDEELRKFFKENFKWEYGYSHKFFVFENEGKLYTVDELIFNTINLLNEHGYMTRFSCQGNKNGTVAYISFSPSLTMEKRKSLFELTSIMLQKGLVVRVDRGWNNPEDRMVIRWEKNPMIGTYEEDCKGDWDVLINKLMCEAVKEWLC